MKYKTKVLKFIRNKKNLIFLFFQVKLYDINHT